MNQLTPNNYNNNLSSIANCDLKVASSNPVTTGTSVPIGEFKVNEFTQNLSNPLTEVFGASIKIGEITPFGNIKGVRDETLKLMVKDSNGHKIAVVLCSSPASPNLVARGAKNSHLAKDMLGAELGNQILTPSYQSDFEGVTYIIMRYYLPLSNHRLLWYFEKAFLSPIVFRWLARMTKATVTKLNSSEIEQKFVIPLQHLIELDAITDRVRAEASQALARLESGQWQPCHVLMHGDLWKGNILLDQENKSQTGFFKIIDWAGSLIHGYAMYDLVRLGSSFKLTNMQMHQQIASHCQILNCDLIDARSHLASALAYLSMNLEDFPLDRFAKTGDHCFAALDNARI